MPSNALRTTEPGRQRVRQTPEPVTTHFCVRVLSLSGYTRFRRLMRTEISSYARLSHPTTEGTHVNEQRERRLIGQRKDGT